MYSLWSVCLSAAKSHNAGGAKPVSDSLMPKKNRILEFVTISFAIYAI